nr:multidrug efflux SMR transporter [Dysgonomonas sp.]
MVKMKGFIFLLVAIIFETLGTSMLKMSEQFTKFTPSVISIISYLITFYFLSLSLKTMPVGIAYGIWGGLGIVLITVIGAVFFKQTPDVPAIIGIGLIVAGVVVVNVFSKMGVH